MELIFKPLLSRAEQAEFCARYSQASGTRLPVEDVQESAFWSLYQGTEMVGGFVLRNEGSFRAVRAIAGSVPASVVAALDDAVEVTGLWAEAGLPRLKSRWMLSQQILLAAKSLGARRILGITTKTQLWNKTYQPIGAQLLYEGLTELEPGFVKPGWVFALDIAQTERHLPAYFMKKIRSPRAARGASATEPVSAPARLA